MVGIWLLHAGVGLLGFLAVLVLVCIADLLLVAGLRFVGFS